MNKTKTMLFAAVAVVTMSAQAYAPAKSPLMTTWGEKVTPENAWREYPRPQMVRDNWTSLNGEWDYAITSVTNTHGRPTKWADTYYGELNHYGMCWLKWADVRRRRN